MDGEKKDILQVDNKASPTNKDELIFRNEQTQPPYEVIEIKKMHAARMQELGQLSSDVCHQLMNQLGGVLGYFEILGHEITDQKIRNDIKIITRACESGKKMIRRIASFGRIRPTSSQLIDINEIVDEVLSFIELIASADVNIRQHSNAIAMVIVDQNEIFQLVLNLITNALDAVKLNMGVKEIKVSVDCLDLGDEFARANSNDKARPGNFVVLTISDNGCGIEESNLGKVLDPYFTTKGERGTGLGLKIVKDIVEKCQGWINISSFPDIGTTFNIFLPLAKR